MQQQMSELEQALYGLQSEDPLKNISILTRLFPEFTIQHDLVVRAGMAFLINTDSNLLQIDMMKVISTTGSTVDVQLLRLT